MFIQYDFKSMNQLKEILLKLRNEETLPSMKAEYDRYFKEVSLVDLLLLELELLNYDDEISIGDLKRLSKIAPSLSFSKELLPANHPITIFKKENHSVKSVLTQIDYLLSLFESDEMQMSETNTLNNFKQYVMQLGSFHNHFNRKEKIIFPILERYGNYSRLSRIVWGIDDQIRGHYKAIKALAMQLPNTEISVLRNTVDKLTRGMEEVIFIEEEIVLPIVNTEFTEEDWLAVTNESDAFGYTLIEPPKEKWRPENLDEEETTTTPLDHVVLGAGGYLTTEEAQYILNNIPLEITFVDRTALFKYYNETTKNPSDIMLIRTPSSIGRNVANCHPPKSLKKMGTLIRDLRTGRRKSESMWFKKKDQYIYITYKPVFNDEGEFLGILEYVQDIQPFFELPCCLVQNKS